MVDLIVIIFTLTVYGILAGAISYYIALGLDSMMDYGGILDWLRWNKFKKYAHKLGKEYLVVEADNPVIIGDSDVSIGSQIADWRHKYYLMVSAYCKPFKLWICTECMSIRISILFNIVCVSFLAIDKSDLWQLAYIVPMCLTTTAFIYFIINYDR